MIHKEPARGEIWDLTLIPERGREQAGHRPALIISVDLFKEGPAPAHRTAVVSNSNSLTERVFQKRIVR